MNKNVIHEQSVGNGAPYLIRSIDVRMKVWRCINYRRYKGGSSCNCLLRGGELFIISLAVFSISKMLLVIFVWVFPFRPSCSSGPRPPGELQRDFLLMTFTSFCSSGISRDKRPYFVPSLPQMLPSVKKRFLAYFARKCSTFLLYQPSLG